MALGQSLGAAATSGGRVSLRASSRPLDAKARARSEDGPSTGRSVSDRLVGSEGVIVTTRTAQVPAAALVEVAGPMRFVFRIDLRDGGADELEGPVERAGRLAASAA